MAFEMRAEFWDLSSPGEGQHAVLLDEAVADAETWTSTQDGVLLPANKEPYAMWVYANTGSVYVEVSAAPVKTAGARSKMIPEGKEAWFLVNPGDKVWAAEIV